MSDPKRKLIKIGALDVLTKALLQFIWPVLLHSSWDIAIYYLRTEFFPIILNVIINGILIESALLFLAVKAYKIGVVLRSLHNLLYGIFCLMTLRLVFLAMASELFRPMIGANIVLFVICVLHLAFSVYFQYMLMFDKPIRTYLAETKKKT